MRTSILLLSVVIHCFSTQVVMSESLDEKAWNTVWDKLKKVLPANTPTESVHALSVIVPATWIKGNRAGLRELQAYAGAIPEENFSIDPSRLKLKLHDAYSRFVLDIVLPDQSQADQEALEKAKDAYGAAIDAFQKRLEAYEAKWEKRKADLISEGEKVDVAARLDFRGDMAGYFSSVQGKLDKASNQIQKYSPPDSHWSRAIRAIRDEVDNAQSDIRGIYTYNGGEATLDAIKTQCPENGPGWDTLALKSTVDTSNLKSNGWTGNGGWKGSFFSVGGATNTQNYEKYLSNISDSFELKFCNLTYISLQPGGWFDISFLQEIDKGNLALKEGSSAAAYTTGGKKILGKDGVIPRIVKGAIVARSIQFNAKLSEANMAELRKSTEGSGGLRIGPWSIGGTKGSSEFRSETSEKVGSYGRSTSSDIPVILAIITEPTE